MGNTSFCTRQPGWLAGVIEGDIEQPGRNRSPREAAPRRKAYSPTHRTEKESRNLRWPVRLKGSLANAPGRVAGRLAGARANAKSSYPMALLAPMPPLVLPAADLAPFGAQWVANGGALSRSLPNSSIQLGKYLDSKVADALAAMLGGIPVVPAQSPRSRTPLHPPAADCVELGDAAIVGGIRKQQFDVAYRPDGARFVSDTKTLNDLDSVGKNWQNMVNDLATEAATVHTRFPMAVVAFVVLVPEPAAANALDPITWRLDGLGGRADEHGPDHVAEAMCFALWDPTTCNVSTTLPDPLTHPDLRIENFSAQVEEAYKTRYAGAPPH